MASQRVYKYYKEFSASVTPRWRKDLQFSANHFHKGNSAFRIIDVSSTGAVDDLYLELNEDEKNDAFKYRDGNPDNRYQTRLEVERQALRAEQKDIRTRLVLFEQSETTTGFIHDLYGIEFQIEPSFFIACTSINWRSTHPSFYYTPSLFPKEDPPAFLSFGKGWCAKLVQRDFDHPLIKRGAVISMTDFGPVLADVSN